ncbi:MAG: alpha/beta hydrolase family protein [Lysobacterales bacterium]
MASRQDRVWLLAAIALATLITGCSLRPLANNCRSQALPVNQHKVVFLHNDGRSSDLTVWYPTVSDSYPRMLFFPGSRLPPERYARLLSDLAAMGLVIVAPMHIDSETIDYTTRPQLAEIWATRKRDGIALLNPTVGTAELPGGVRISEQPVIVAGHSFGAFTAQALVGATAIGDSPLSHNYPIAAVVALSPPGPLPNFIAEDAWTQLNTPQLVTTGTADISPGFSDDWTLHATSYRQAMAGDQWLWVGTDVDHYFGRLIGQLDRQQPPQLAQYQDLLLTINGFLQHYTRPNTGRCARPLVVGSSPLATISHR